MTIKSDYYGGGSATPLILQSGANSNQLYLATSGNVGINTNSPTAKLQVVGEYIRLVNSADSQNILLHADTSRVAVSAPNGNLAFDTANAERMRIFSDGNVSISNSPSNAGFKLDVNGTGRFSGNLAIGATTTTNARLVVDGGTASSLSSTLMLNQGAGGSSFSQINGSGDASHGIVLRGIPVNGNTSDFSVTPSDVMSFYEFGGEFRWYQKNGSLSERMRITAGGNVGIGTTVEAGRLNINSTNSGGDSTALSLMNRGTANNTAVQISFRGLTAGGSENDYGYIKMVQTNTSTPASDLSFWTQSGSVAERMRITSGGNTELYGNLSLRAAATGSTATHVPVFIADPASTTRSLLTRTLQNFKFDVGSFIAKGVRSNVGDFTRTLDSTNDYSLWQDNFSWLSSYYDTKIIIEAQTTGRIQSTQSFDKVLSIGWGISSDNDFNSESYCTCNVPLGPGVVDYNVIINGTITITSTSELKMVLHVQIANGNVIVQNIIRMVNLSASAAMLNAAKNIAFTGKMDVTGTHTWSQRQTYLRLN
jgi:hypothetical protein